MDRFRPYRRSQTIRDFHAQVQLSCADLIYPYFVVEGINIKSEISTLRNVFHFSIDRLLGDIAELVTLGINKILLFGVIAEQLKDSTGSNAYVSDNLIVRAVSEIKAIYPELIVMTDVCMCGYTDHGHCGLVNQQSLEIDNDLTLPLLAHMALSHAQAGADYVAPSAMMDGQVSAIRALLDSSGFTSTKIMAYSAKYASVFYGPFRGAVASAPKFGDRRTYQMDPRNVDQAIPEVKADLLEGADIVMVKPAHTYLDVIGRIKSELPDTQLAAYHVSGEYMMIKEGAASGFFEERSAMLEVLTAIKRAGADYIITYWAKDFARSPL